MGYKDLEWFNMALLAKQGWRLVQNPSGLVAKIIKEKYYPQGTFMEANLGRQPSYVWRSIWNARRLLVEGLAWRVGDGSKISIWKDKWVSTSTARLIQSLVLILAQDAKVSELLDKETNWWNTTLVHEVFSAEETGLISNMAERFEVDKGSCSNRDSNKGLWKAIWNNGVPRPVKTFLWKACNNIFPTKENLFKKHVTLDPPCPICSLEGETVGHILWSCPSAHDVWNECTTRINKSTSDYIDFISIMEKMMKRTSEEEMKLVAIAARQIWHRRNSMVFEGKFTSPTTILRISKDQLETHLMAEKQERDRRSTPRRPEAKCWKKLPAGSFKVNWDTLVDNTRRRVGIGHIVRDYGGEVIAMLCETKDYVQDPATAEALAARRGV
ncbi:uncharacterized protein LOC132174415 [Corylus avellana]|uniref:uncharacterized protein LOC132174415 n=1 Tax=Corylus avellana TaxID=13451 RepID=UPI00286C751D|nr:uncharacterized protein LOC132174415 [Corylus avellana]